MKSSAATAEKFAPVDEAPMTPPTVLIVDDEPLVRWSLKERLMREGYRVLEASTAEDALARSADHVDVMLLDYRLPDATGLAVLHQLGATHPEILVILMTAYSTVENAVEAITLGAFDYINKPFDVDDVAFLVEKAHAIRDMNGPNTAFSARNAS